MAKTANNSIAPRNPNYAPSAADYDDRGKKFTTFINGNAIKGMLEKSLSDPRMVAQLTATLIAVVSQNEKLQKAPPWQILSSALRFEVGMGLSLALGDYSIIPYENKRTGEVTAQGQLQVNGIKRMCIATGAYKKIECYDVRKGEFLGRDPETRDPIFQWKSDEEREMLPVIGYYTFFILNDAYNNFTSKIYWTYDKILRHADRYSKAFDLEIWKAIQNGATQGQDKWGKTWYANSKREGSPWYGDSKDGGHMKMCAKTMYKQLLGSGFAPKSTTVQTAMTIDNAMESSDEPVYYADEFDRMAKEAALEDARSTPAVQIEAPTTSITFQTENAAEGIVEAEKPIPEPVQAQTAAPEPAKKRGRQAKKADEPAAPPPAPAPVPEQPTMMDFPDMRGDPFPEYDDPLGGW